MSLCLTIAWRLIWSIGYRVYCWSEPLYKSSTLITFQCFFDRLLSLKAPFGHLETATDLYDMFLTRLSTAVFRRRRRGWLVWRSVWTWTWGATPQFWRVFLVRAAAATTAFGHCWPTTLLVGLGALKAGSAVGQDGSLTITSQLHLSFWWKKIFLQIPLFHSFKSFARLGLVQWGAFLDDERALHWLKTLSCT